MNKKIIFFLEGSFHLQYLSVLIDDFDKNPSIDLSIITLQDLSTSNFKNTKILNINKSEIAKTLLELQADYFITTTPGIGSTYFPKSKIFPTKSRPKYIYVFHSLVSPNEVYFKNSFYYFDFIFSPNQIITNQLDHLTSKKTSIINTGYPLFLNNNTNVTMKETNGNVLIAPSWGDQNFLTNYEFMNKLIKYLKSKNLTIFIRPHVMTSESLILDMYKELTIDRSDSVQFNKYNYLFTDWSGIALEFFYYKKQKVFFVDSPKKIRRKMTKKELNFELIEYKIRELIGEVISYDFDLNNLDLKNLHIESDNYIESLFTPKFKIEDIYKILKI